MDGNTAGSDEAGSEAPSTTPTKAELTKPFEFTSDVVKGLLTAAAAVLALTVTFSNDILKDANNTSHNFLAASWVLLVASLLWGGMAQWALIQGVSAIAKGEAHFVADKPYRGLVRMQIVFLGMALFCIASDGAGNLVSFHTHFL